MKDMDEMYREYATPVYRYLFSLCRDADTAEELCAETFFRAVQSIGRYDGSSKLLTWLCGIAKNVWRQELDKRRRHGPTLELETQPLQDPAPGPGQAAEEGEQRVLLYRQMQALDAATREVLYLRLAADLSYREIGEVLGRSENWARVTFYRGKEKLKKGGMQDDG